MQLSYQLRLLVYAICIVFGKHLYPMELPANWVLYDRSKTPTRDLSDNIDFRKTIGRVKNGQLNELSTALEKFPSFIDAEDSGGNSLLTHAAINGQTEIAKFLIKKGAAVNWPNKKWKTPLAIAINAHNESMIELLTVNRAIFYAKFVIMLKPTKDYADSIANVFRNLYPIPAYETKLLPIAAEKLHMSLLYAVMPMTYVKDKLLDVSSFLLESVATISEQTVKQWLNKINLSQITWHRLKPFGRFISISYHASNPRLFNNFIDTLYKDINTVPSINISDMYPTRESLHVSVLKNERDKPIKSDIELLQPVVFGLNRLDLGDTSIKLVISMEVPGIRLKPVVKIIETNYKDEYY